MNQKEKKIIQKIKDLIAKLDKDFKEIEDGV